MNRDSRSIPDWRLPSGVDRGLWDYLHSEEMVHGYDAQMAASPLATADVSSARPTHCMPPCTMGCSTPNISVKRVRIIAGCPILVRW